MDVSMVLFLLGMVQSPDSDKIKAEWDKLDVKQQTALIHQVEREYKIDLEKPDTAALEELRNIQFRSWDNMK
jgi:hypothetical protein